MDIDDVALDDKDSAVITYVAGYIAHKAILKFPCKDCANFMMMPKESATFSMYSLTIKA